MTLLDLCEPLFQYICRLNRLARAGADLPASQIRSEIKGILDQMRATAAQTPGLQTQFEVVEGRSGKGGIELVLVFFADFMVRDSGLRCAGDWQDIAEEYNSLGGDEKFFDLLDETLADQSQAATERLTVFYTCLGLGFSGWFADQPEFLRRKMIDCAARIRGQMDPADAQRICADAYEHTDRRDLDLPPARGLIGIGMVLVSLIAVLFIGSLFLYNVSQRGLSNALESIITHGQTGTEAGS